MSRSIRISVVLFLWSALASLGASERDFLGVPRTDIERIIELGYNLDERVPGLIESMIVDYPDSPLGLCLKAARLFRLDGYAGGTNETLAEEFEETSSEAIEAAKRYFKANEDDPEARYALAMCELNLARYYIENSRWFSGFFKANSGIGHLRAILKEYPDFHDAKMPLGVANCFLDKTPVYLKPIAALLRFSGNMELGLQQLSDAENKGFLTRYESLYYQIGVQWELLENEEKAGEILDRFIARFPRNVDALAMKAHLDRKQERYDAALAGYERVFALDESVYLGDVIDWLVLHAANCAIHLEKPEIALEKSKTLLASDGAFKEEIRPWGQVIEANALLHMGRKEEARVKFEQVSRRGNPRAYRAAKDILEELDAAETE